MIHIKNITVILILVLSIKSILKCQNTSEKIIDTLVYEIKEERIFFNSSNIVYPFTLQVRNYSEWGYFNIEYGHSKLNSDWIVVYPNKEFIGKPIKTSYVYDTIDIDTLKNYFSINHNINDVDKHNLSESQLKTLLKEIKYTYLFESIGFDKTFDKKNNNFRVIVPRNIDRENFDIISVSFNGDSVNLFYTLIKTWNLQEYTILKNDSISIRLNKINKLKKLMETVDISSIKSDYSSSELFCRESEFLLELNINNKYFHFFICPFKNAKSKIKKKEFKTLIEIQKELLFIKRKYFNYKNT